MPLILLASFWFLFLIHTFPIFLMIIMQMLSNFDSSGGLEVVHAALLQLKVTVTHYNYIPVQIIIYEYIFS